jgi:hypothetical protein
MAQEIKFELDLEVTRFHRTMDGAIRAARLFDAELKDIIKSGGQLDSKFGGLKLAIKVDTSDLDRAEGKVKGLEGQTPKVTVQTDTSELDGVETRIKAIDGMTPKVNVQADVGGLNRADARIKEIDGQSPKVNVQADVGGLNRADARIKEIDGQSPKVTIDVDKSELDGIKNALGDLKKLAVIDIVMNLPGQVGGIAGAVTNLPVISTINDQQGAARLLEARTPQAAGAAGAVEDAFLQGFGETRLELANVAAQIEQAGASAEEALIPVLQVATTQGQEVNEVFTAMSRLVTSGLVPDFETAANVMTVGFQNGADAGGDFLDTIREYSSQFAEAGFSAEEMLGLLSSGLAEGAFNADKLADAVKESVNIRVAEAVQDPESAPAQALTRLGQFDEAEAFEQGKLSGAQFLEGLIAAAEEKGSAFDLFEIMGGAGEDLTTGVLQDIDWSGLEIPEEVASDAAANFADTLGNDLKILTREFEAGLVDAVKIGGQSLTDWIATAREQLSTLSSEIASGTALPEALEIALEAPGLADQIRSFEASIGNFIIEMELIVAGVLDFMGQGEAAKGIRESVADQAGNQLQYELQLADTEEELATIVQRAFNRGVEAADIIAIVDEASGVLAEGGQKISAQTLLTQFQEVMGTIMTQPTAEQRLEFANTPGNSWADAASGAGIPAFTAEDVATIEASVEAITESREEADAAAPIFTTMWEALKDNAFFAGEAETATSRMGDQLKLTTPEVEALDTSVMTLTDNLEDLEEGGPAALSAIMDNIDENGDGIISWIERFNSQLDAAIEKAAIAAENVRILNEAGGSGGGAFEESEGKALGGSVFGGEMYKVGERGVELFAPGMDGSIIPNSLTQILLGLQAGGGGGGVTNNYVTLNNQINAQGMAGAFAAGRTTADRLRGMF